jgi:hypothetical protein
MKKLFLGLAVGVALSGIACIIAIPKIKEVAYNSGYTAGDKQGTTDGTAAGVIEGITEYKAREKQVRDSTVTAEHKEAALRRAVYKPHKKILPIQNWHVIDGKIAAPMPDTART